MIYPATPTPYTTLARVQQETRNPDAEKADIMNDAINLASRAVDDYCRRDFGYHDFSETEMVVPSNWATKNIIWFPWPIITLTGLAKEGVLIPTTEYVFFPGGENVRYWNELADWFYIGSSGNMIDMPQVDWISRGPLGPSGWNWDRESLRPPMITLSGTFGYPPAQGQSGPDYTQVPPTLPPAIIRATTMIAAVFSGEMRKEVMGPDGTKESLFTNTIPPTAKQLLAKWRNQYL
jgi:hypothetical protein